jgi:hypothetical protein
VSRTCEFVRCGRNDRTRLEWRSLTTGRTGPIFPKPGESEGPFVTQAKIERLFFLADFFFFADLALSDFGRSRFLSLSLLFGFAGFF